MFSPPFQNPDISSFGPLHRCDEEHPMYMRRKKEKAAYVNYEKKAGMERDEDGKRKGEFRWGVSERRRRGKREEIEKEEKSHDDASATSSGLVAVATDRSGATAAAAFAFC
jgi:hypothetical protein